MTKILVTGAHGFIGKNLCCQLKNIGWDVLEYDIGSDRLEEYIKLCEFVFHLAGVNRPKDEKEFLDGNFGFTSDLLNLLKRFGNKAPVLMTSSVQAELDNPYGRSKKAGEDLLLAYAAEQGVKTPIFRLPNVFGKWCRPNYNSAVATFCHNIARGLPITINDASVRMRLVYIDDVVNALIGAMEGRERYDGAFCAVPEVVEIDLGKIAELIHSFRKNLQIPDLSDAFTKKLYSTYLSYLPEEGFSYPLEMHTDHRGSFTEFLKTPDRGQVSVNISKPHIVKGNHWHHTKAEKFLVVSGRGVIRFRKFGETTVQEYFVSGEKLEAVDIPPGYTHNIENLGDTDLVTIMWVNEIFDPDRPDTYALTV